MQYNAAFEITGKSREDFIGVFSECFGFVPSPRLSQMRRRQNLWAIFSQKIGENDQDLGCFFRIFWHRSRAPQAIFKNFSAIFFQK